MRRAGEAGRWSCIGVTGNLLYGQRRATENGEGGRARVISCSTQRFKVWVAPTESVIARESRWFAKREMTRCVPEARRKTTRGMTCIRLRLGLQYVEEERRILSVSSYLARSPVVATSTQTRSRIL